jgi:hypothetical protein
MRAPMVRPGVADSAEIRGSLRIDLGALEP